MGMSCVYQRPQPLLHALLLLCCSIPLIMVGDWMGGSVMGACVRMSRSGFEMVRDGPDTSEIVWVRAACFFGLRGIGHVRD